MVMFSVNPEIGHVPNASLGLSGLQWSFFGLTRSLCYVVAVSSWYYLLATYMTVSLLFLFLINCVFGFRGS